MVDYNGASRDFGYVSGISLRELAASGEHQAVFVVGDDADITRPSRDGQVDFATQSATVMFMNRGKNTGAGPAFVYWTSPNSADPTGVYYDGSVPFGQLTDIVVVNSFLE
jgi:hypothetical protein